MSLFLVATAVPLVGAILSLLVGGDRARGLLLATAATVSFGLCAVSMTTLPTDGASHAGTDDALAMLGLFVVNAVVLAVCWFRVGEGEASAGRWQDALSLGLLAPAQLACAATEPSLLIAALGVTAFLVAVVVGLRKTPDAIVAAWQLAVSTCLGVGLTMVAMVAVSGGVEVATKSALLLALAGLGLLAGLPPLSVHWVRAHGEVQPALRPLVSCIVPVLVVIALVRLKLASGMIGGALDTVFLYGGATVVALAVVAMARTQSVSHLLAFSTVQHVGLVVFALGAGTAGILAGLLHAITHALTKCTIFLAGAALVPRTGNSSPSASVRPARFAFVIAILALGGLPPSGVFVSQVQILRAGLTSSPRATMVVVAALGVGLVLLISSAQQGLNAARGTGVRGANLLASAVLLTLSLTVVGLGVYLPTALRVQLERAVAGVVVAASESTTTTVPGTAR